MIEKTINVDSSTALQKIIDSIGNTPSKLTFETDAIEINSRLRVYNNTEWDGKGCKFTLKENVPTSIFGEQIPLIGSKYTTAISNLKFHDLKFDGNRDKQNKVPTKNGKSWGLGFHNIFMIGNLSNVSYANASNCEFYNIEFKNNLGDEIRTEGITNIIVHDCTSSLSGHDSFNFSGANGGEIYNCHVDMAVGSGIRTRSCKNFKIHDCTCDNSKGLTYGPGIQIQSTAKNWISTGIEIYNCSVNDTFGPGVQVVSSVPNAGSISIHNCLFVGCGAMPASVNRPTVGGIIFNGFSDVSIKYNTFDKCLGYGIAAGDYDVTSSYGGTAVIEGNIITNTQPCYKQGTYSGTGIANLSGSEYKFTVNNNCQYGNKKANHYGVAFSNGISADPLYVGSGDYHLQDSSPCYFKDYEIGCYNGVNYHTDEVKLSPSEIVGDNAAVIILCETKDDAKKLEGSINSSGLLSDEKLIVYSKS